MTGGNAGSTFDYLGPQRTPAARRKPTHGAGGHVLAQRDWFMHLRAVLASPWLAVLLLALYILCTM